MSTSQTAMIIAHTCGSCKNDATHLSLYTASRPNVRCSHEVYVQLSLHAVHVHYNNGH